MAGRRPGPPRRLVRETTFMPRAWGSRRAGTMTAARNRASAAAAASVAGSEIKYFDTTKAATALVASDDWTATEFDPATINTLFAPVKGTGINNRIGRKASVLKIKIRGLVIIAAQSNQTVTDASVAVRLALVQDMQTNKVQAQGEEVFKAPATVAAPNAVCSWQSLDTFGRFRVLKDKFFTIQNPNMSYDGTNIEQNGLVRTFKLSHSFRAPVDVNFNATNGATVADIVDNSWHVMANASGVTLAPLILYECRVSYKG